MRINMRSLALPPLFVFAVIVITIFIYFHQGGSVKKNNDPSTQWSEYIDSYGGKEAYEKFKDDYKDRPSESHNVSHLFGKLLYEKLGSAGFAICDDSFGSGCQHGYLTRAIEDRGVAILTTLGEVCERSSTQEPCFHGIGHGISAHFGEKSIADSLAVCSQIYGPIKEHAQACIRGVFMDYYAPLIVSGGSFITNSRAMDSANPYDICAGTKLPTLYKSSCYYALPHWWFGQKEMTPQKVGGLCKQAPDTYSEDCYKGIGVDLPAQLKYDQKSIIETCEAMGSGAALACLKSSAATLVSLQLDACLLQKEAHLPCKDGTQKAP